MSGGIPIPGLASILSDPADGTATVVQGLDTVPADDQPTTAEVNVVHLSWDIMVGSRHAAVPPGRLVLAVLAVPARTCPRADGSSASPRLPVSRPWSSMEAGWVVSEVGRQPWIVYNLMKVEDAATGNTGVWVTFVLVVALYVGLGVTTVLILRNMSRRFRDRTVADYDVPYGPSRPGARSGVEREEVTVS